MRNVVSIKKYYIIHKYTQMHMESLRFEAYASNNDIKFKSDEDIYENIMNYLIIQL